jgi:hypothetical protein
MDERIVVDPVLRQRLRFERTTDPDGGEVLHVETWVDSGGGVTRIVKARRSSPDLLIEVPHPVGW